MSKIALSRIPSQIFYKDALTLSRRGQPIPQLVCVGTPCDLYQPEVVRCTNIGGAGTDVDWKCEADLPEALRFGRVQVSCEGWSGPGDSQVLKGSCSLEYNLVQLPDSLRRPDEPLFRPRLSKWVEDAYNNPSATAFTILWTACILFILYGFLKSCWTGRTGTANSARPRPRPPGSGSGPGWFSGFSDHRPNDNADPPPPYSKYPNTASANAQGEGWRPGFWTGTALGGLGTYLLNRNQRERVQPTATAYDWEQDRAFQPTSGFYSTRGSGSRSRFTSDDRGEGPSNSGPMRRSAGLGGSNVR